MKRLARSFGLIASVAGLAFVARLLAMRWTETEAALRGADGWRLLLAAVCAALGMIYAASGWGIALRMFGASITITRAVALYFRGEVAKYVPGGAWAVVGRGELARREGIAPTVAYSSVLLSLAALYVSCAALVAALLLLGLRATAAPVVAAVTFVLGIVALHPRALELFRAIAQRLTRRELTVRIPSWAASSRMVVFYLPVWLAVGTATWAIVRALGGTTDWPHVVLAAATAWLAGFVAVPVPGGIGIREAVFVAAMPSASAGTAAAAALIARALFMAVDATGAAASWLPSRRRRG